MKNSSWRDEPAWLGVGDVVGNLLVPVRGWNREPGLKVPHEPGRGLAWLSSRCRDLLVSVCARTGTKGPPRGCAEPRARVDTFRRGSWLELRLKVTL